MEKKEQQTKLHKKYDHKCNLSDCVEGMNGQKTNQT